MWYIQRPYVFALFFLFRRTLGSYYCARHLAGFPPYITCMHLHLHYCIDSSRVNCERVTTLRCSVARHIILVLSAVHLKIHYGAPPAAPMQMLPMMLASSYTRTRWPFTFLQGSCVLLMQLYQPYYHMLEKLPIDSAFDTCSRTHCALGTLINVLNTLKKLVEVVKVSEPSVVLVLCLLPCFLATDRKSVLHLKDNSHVSLCCSSVGQ